MPNSQLQNNVYPVPEEHQQYLGSSISYENMKMTKSRLEQAKKTGNMAEFERKGGAQTLKWIDETLKTDRDAIHGEKKIGMDTGRENQFLKTHEKDKSKNPTNVGGLPKINKGNVSRKIMSNKEVYNESVESEINSIIYLIEYMNNKNSQIL
jgi:hypothetical protein